MAAEPKFSIIIPIETRRSAWEFCLQQWCQAQDFPRDRYEVIAVVPRGFSEQMLSQLRSILTPEDGIGRADERHEVGLRALGAPLANGEFLVFTGTNCI